MDGLPDPDWYFDNVLRFARPGVMQLDVDPTSGWQAWWRSAAEEVPDLARRQGFVLTCAQLTGLGSSRAATRWALDRGRFTAAGRGAVGVVDVRDDDAFLAARRRHAVLAAAATLRHRDAVVSGRSAAILHGLPTLEIPSAAEITAATRPGSRNGVHTRVATVADSAVGSWFGVPVTTVARTLVDLARHDRRDAIMAADAARRAHLVNPADVRAALADAAGWPGVRQARGVLELARPEAESALESLVRLALHDAGFPRPELQFRIKAYRVDLCWPRRRLVIEVDGLAKYAAGAWRSEQRREQALRRAGYRVERIIWDDLLRHWPSTVEYLRQAFDASSRPKWS